MPEREVRDRRRKSVGKTQRSPDSQPEKPQKDSDSSSRTLTADHAGQTMRTSRILAFVGISVAVFILYQFPHLRQPLHSLLEPWLEGSESSLPGTAHSTVMPIRTDWEKRNAIVNSFKHAWHAYERDAMGDDEYHPISHRGTNLSRSGGIGYTVVDSIDTMYIMGLEEEYKRARTWVATKLTFDRDGDFNTFETTIRVLGGLLSAYALTDDPLYVERARELGNRILPVFDTPTGLPLSMVNLAKYKGVSDYGNNHLISTAEAATLQLEFRYLAELLDDDTYWRKAEKAIQVIKEARMPSGLASIFMDPKVGNFVMSPIRLGSRGDSYYEYLLKQYLQTSQTELVYREMYDDTMQAIHDHLIQKGVYTKITYTAELLPERDGSGGITWRLSPKQDHLVCFLGGSLMLGAVTAGALVHPVSVPPRHGELSEIGLRDWTTGAALIKTCMDTYSTASGLSPEIVHFRTPSDGMGSNGEIPHDWYIRGNKPGSHPPLDARYILRPETVESLFIAYRLTADTRYRDYGWKIFQAIEKHCRMEGGGYASVLNVEEVPVKHEDKMETFFMSETLKYLYLLFSDNTTLPLNEWVFNTEAHPLPIFQPSFKTGFS